MKDINKTKRPARKPVTAFRTALVKLHLADQKAIFNGLPPAIMAALWSDRLEESIRKSRKREQKDVLQQIVEKITPGVYDRRSSAKRKQFLVFYRKLQPAVLAAFEADAPRLRNISTLLGEAPTVAAIAQEADLPKCNCSLAERGTNCDDCSFSTNCKSIPCTATWLGCGCWWLHPCDGICK